MEKELAREKVGTFLGKITENKRSKEPVRTYYMGTNEH